MIPPDVKPEHPPRETLAFDSLTTRDLFAAFALAGLLAAHTDDMALPDRERAAKLAFGYADAMLKRRAQPAD